MSIQNIIGYSLLVLFCISIIIYNLEYFKPIEGLTSPSPNASNEIKQYQLYNLIDYRGLDQKCGNYTSKF